MINLWKDVPGFEGRYQVSLWGEVKSLSREISNGFRVRVCREKVLKANTDRDGYEYLALRKGQGKAVTFKVHRLVALTFFGESDLCVNHIDGNRANNFIENLEYVTVAENNRHARKRAPFKMAKGESHYRYRITSSDRQKISSLIRSGVARSVVAEMFKIHPFTTYKIIKGKECKP